MSPPRSVVRRVVAILAMFDRGRLAISAADIASGLGISSASAYRYANDLLVAGLLAKSGTHFRPGPRIIELEYLIRTFDPIISSGEAALRELAVATGHDVLLCHAYGDSVVNVLHLPGRRPLHLTYTKGLPMPTFRGAQARVVLAFTEARRLKRLYERAIDDPALRGDVDAIGRGWPAFSAALRRVRAAGHCIAHGELGQGLTGIAAPVIGIDGTVLGSVVLVLGVAPGPRKTRSLVGLVMADAAALSARVAALEGRPRNGR